MLRMANLEERLQKTYAAHGVGREQRESIQTFLNLLARKDRATYEHSVRVGMLAAAIGEHLQLDAKALLYAGLLHDAGKSLVSKETLTKTEGFGKKEFDEMKPHPLDAHRLLRGIHDFSADIAVRHHHFQEKGYPENLPEYLHAYGEPTKARIDHYARLLSLADFYDAASTRVNDAHGVKRKLTDAEVRNLMIAKHPGLEQLINELYDKKIF